MLVGIKIQINDSSINYYSKPFILSFYDDTFNAQLIRDVDFSILIKKYDNVSLEIIEYSNKTDFYRLNTQNIEDHKCRILNKSNFIFENFDEKYESPDFQKSLFIKELSDIDNLTVAFTTILTNNDDKYILTTPIITGLKNLFFNSKKTVQNILS